MNPAGSKGWRREHAPRASTHSQESQIHSLFCPPNRITSLSATLIYQQVPKVCTQRSGMPHSLHIYIYKHSGINTYIQTCWLDAAGVWACSTGCTRGVYSSHRECIQPQAGTDQDFRAQKGISRHRRGISGLCSLSHHTATFPADSRTTTDPPAKHFTSREGRA